MKLKSIALLFSFFIMLNMAFAQKSNFSPVNTKHNIKFGINTFFNEDEFVLGVSWEFKIANRQSIQLELSPKLYKDNYSKRNGIAFAASYRKYISKNKEGLQGIYLSPMIKYGVLNENYTGYGFRKSISNDFNAALLFGKQWVFKSGFSLDINGGVGLFNSKYVSTNTDPYGIPRTYTTRDNNYGITPNFNLKVGYAF